MSKVTKVYEGEANYGRRAYLNLESDMVVFDNSNEEYGIIEFPIKLLKEKLNEHNNS